MNARLDAKITDDYPEFVEALPGFIYPHYLRGVPSCAVAQCAPSPVFGQITDVQLIIRSAASRAELLRCVAGHASARLARKSFMIGLLSVKMRPRLDMCKMD